MVDISELDGDSDLFKAEIDTLSNLLMDYGFTNRKTTLLVAETADDDFAVTRNSMRKANGEGRTDACLNSILL